MNRAGMRLTCGNLLAIAVMSVIGCGGGIGLAPPACEGFSTAECQDAIGAAVRAVPRAVASRTLVSARVERHDAAEAGMCDDWAVCEPAEAVAIVWLIYPGPGGNESWPVAVARSSTEAAMSAAKPFPDSIDARQSP